MYRLIIQIGLKSVFVFVLLFLGSVGFLDCRPHTPMSFGCLYVLGVWWFWGPLEHNYDNKLQKLQKLLKNTNEFKK